MDNPTRQITLQCDTRRQIVDLTVGSSTQHEIAEIEKQLAANLQLEIFPTKDPYQYRRIQGQYDISAFRNKDFGEAVRIAVKQFVGPQPVVTDAYVESESEVGQQIYPLTTFSDFGSFLKRVEEDTPFIEAGLTVHGPRGAALGVYALDKLKRLEINSNLNSNEYTAPCTNIQKSLEGLERIDTSKEEDEGTVPAKQTWTVVSGSKLYFQLLLFYWGVCCHSVLNTDILGGNFAHLRVANHLAVASL